MNLGILSSTRCIAVAFRLECVSLRPVNIYELFTAFKNLNSSSSSNTTVQQALRKCIFLGHIEPYVILIGGDEISLRAVKSCWMRTQLRPPPGFLIESIGDAGGLVLNSVPQYASMRLEEIVFQIICQVASVEPTCSERQLFACLHSIYADMNSGLPPRQAVHIALRSLIKAGSIYFCGQGYNLLTPDKMQVANWLKNLPTDVAPQGYDSPASSVYSRIYPKTPAQMQYQLQRQNAKETSGVVERAPLVDPDSDLPGTNLMQFTDELNPLRHGGVGRPQDVTESLEYPHQQDNSNNDTVTKVDARSRKVCNSVLQQGKSSLCPSPTLGRLLSPHNARVEAVNEAGPSEANKFPSGNSIQSSAAEGSVSSINCFFNTSLSVASRAECRLPQNGNLPNRGQFSQSVYLSVDSKNHTRLHQEHKSIGAFDGRALTDQRAVFTKSADFHIPRIFEQSGSMPNEEGKKRGSHSLVQWFVRRVRRLRQSMRRMSQQPDWPTVSMPAFPMFYQNNNATAQFDPIDKSSTPHRQHVRSRTLTRESVDSDIFQSRQQLHLQQPLLNIEIEPPPEWRNSDFLQTANNLRRCLSLAENQRITEFKGSSPMVATFSMDVIPETQSICNPFGHLIPHCANQTPEPIMHINNKFGRLRKGSPLQRITSSQQWHEPGLTSLSFLSLNAVPAPVLEGNPFDAFPEQVSQSSSRLMFLPAYTDGLGAKLHNSEHPHGAKVRSDRPLDSNGVHNLARSGRDSGFIDTGPTAHAQLYDSTYSVMHKRHVSDPAHQESVTSKHFSSAFNDFSSGALEEKNLSVVASNQPPSSSGIWWTTGFFPVSAPSHMPVDPCGVSNQLQKITSKNLSPLPMKSLD